MFKSCTCHIIIGGLCCLPTRDFRAVAQGSLWQPADPAPLRTAATACSSSMTQCSTTSSLAARSDFPTEGIMHLVGVGPPGAVSSAVCVCRPPMGSLWPAAWAHGVRPCPQPVDSQTVTTPPAHPVAAAPSSCTPCLYHPPRISLAGRFHLTIHSFILSPFRLNHHSWQSGYRLHLVPRTVSLGRVHLGLSMLLHSSKICLSTCLYSLSIMLPGVETCHC